MDVPIHGFAARQSTRIAGCYDIVRRCANGNFSLHTYGTYASAETAQEAIEWLTAHHG